MKATDLMIGDWVQGFVPNTNSRVEAIPSEYRLGVLTNGVTYIVSVADDFQPIPLTPEILKKNGFEPTSAQSEMLLQGEGQEVWLNNHGENFWANIKNDKYYFEGYVKCVHELQHALRLCGIEKEVEL